MRSEGTKGDWYQVRHRFRYDFSITDLGLVHLDVRSNITDLTQTVTPTLTHRFVSWLAEVGIPEDRVKHVIVGPNKVVWCEAKPPIAESNIYDPIFVVEAKLNHDSIALFLHAKDNRETMLFKLAWIGR
jgi:hypothetical protein